ncbi:MAG: RNA polymerase-binding protein DksA [Rickettsiales bacterium]|nr:RNA polymerase-binding protein DksA [Rickettsiales bacterium]|tara:strand:+ start:55374 stop:55796 length:423 start_codon:yes stop_codon:yes gene_type:complete
MKSKNLKKYEPNKNEDFMNSKQLEYFKQKLLTWKKEVLRDSNITLMKLKEESTNKPDATDRASLESDRTLELRTRDRLRKLLSKIDKALSKIDDGSYGYCEQTLEPISLERLKARPIATLSLEAQENHEKSERIYKEKEY